VTPIASGVAIAGFAREKREAVVGICRRNSDRGFIVRKFYSMLSRNCSANNGCRRFIRPRAKTVARRRIVVEKWSVSPVKEI
jgi:hypothetical protein